MNKQNDLISKALNIFKVRGNEFWLAGILALVLSFILFGNGIGGNFVFDDTIVIVGNPLINGRLDNLREIFLSPYFAFQPSPGLYRPLTIASYSFNAFLFGFSPASFHVVNIILHALVSFFAFVFLRRLAGGFDHLGKLGVSKTSAWIGLLFFVFLPIHVEAVTSIVGRAEILSLLFVILALLLSLQRKYFFASIFFLFGLLSKEMAIVFFPVFLFLEFSQRKKIKMVVKNSLYFVFAIGFYALLRFVALGGYFLKNDATFVYNPIKFSSFFSGLWTSFKVMYLYVEKIFWPASLSSDYSFNQIRLVENIFSSPEAVTGIVILVLLVWFFFKSKDFLLRLGIVIFLASYFIVSNWIFKTGTIMAERLMYTPSLGIAVMVTAFSNRLILKKEIVKKVTYIGLALILSIYGDVIINRNKDWLSDKNLYESAYAAAPDSVVNQVNAAYLSFIEGKHEETEDRINEVLSAVPEHVPAINLAGQNYKKLGQYQKAEESWKNAIELRKDYLRAYLSLGVLYYENGYFRSAEKVLAEAIDIYPRWSEILFLALTKVGLGEPESAIELIRKHFGDQPPQKDLKFALGWAYLNKGERTLAYGYFDQIKDPKISMDDFVRTFEGSKVVILGEF